MQPSQRPNPSTLVRSRRRGSRWPATERSATDSDATVSPSALRMIEQRPCTSLTPLSIRKMAAVSPRTESQRLVGVARSEFQLEQDSVQPYYRHWRTDRRIPGLTPRASDPGDMTPVVRANLRRYGSPGRLRSAKGIESRVELALLACIEIAGQAIVVNAYRQTAARSRHEHGGYVQSLGSVEHYVGLSRVEENIHRNICLHTSSPMRPTFPSRPA
jgi:hypothetical protein